MKANIYLNFPGQTEEAFNFYRSVFGGEFLALQRFREVPDLPPTPEADLDKIMHVALPVGDNVLMGTDALEPPGQAVIMGTNVSISLHPDSEAEAKRLFEGLSAGGQVEMPLQPMFWGALWAAFTDKFGVKWMINYELPKA